MSRFRRKQSPASELRLSFNPGTALRNGLESLAIGLAFWFTAAIVLGLI